MSARDWQPGDEALVRVEVLSVGPTYTKARMTARHDFDGGLIYPSTADLLPVSQPDEDAIERAAREVAKMSAFGFEQARELVTALLASPVQPGRSEAEIKAEALREAAQGLPSEARTAVLVHALEIEDAAYRAARVADTTDTEGGE